jgi:hypothetical protein
MYLPTPRLLSAHLSLAGIDNYLGATGTIASMSLFEAPKRILEFGSILIASLGLALIPIFVSIKGITKYGKSMLVLAVTVLFILWLYLTDSDPGTWHFLPIAFPLIMVFVAIGLNKMTKINRRIVFSSACVLILVNGIFLNANVLAKQNPYATNYESQLKSLLDGSYVVCNSGGDYGLDNYYVMASGKDIRPIFIDGDIPDVSMFSPIKEVEYEAYLENYLETNYNIKPAQAVIQVQGMIKHKLEVHLSPRYQDYLKWMNDKYGLPTQFPYSSTQGSNTLAQVQWLLSQGDNVFLAKPSVTPYWEGIFQTESYSDTLDMIVGVNLGY